MLNVSGAIIRAVQLVVTDTLTAALDAMGARFKNPRHLSEATGLAMVGLTVRSFNEPSVRAESWAPLAPETIAQKIKEKTSTAILKRHTLLWRSWRVVEAHSDFVRVGSDRFYAIFHQFGTRRGVPARPMLPVTGGPENSTLTPLAVRNVVAAAKAALRDLLGQ